MKALYIKVVRCTFIHTEIVKEKKKWKNWSFSDIKMLNG